MLATVFALALFAGFLVPAVRAEGKEDYGASTELGRDTSLTLQALSLVRSASRSACCAVLQSRAALRSCASAS